MFGHNQLVHIPSHGIIVSGESILSPISIRSEVRNRYSIQQDEESFFSSPDLMVQRTVELNIIATVLVSLPNHDGAISADGINSVIEGQIRAILADNSDDEDKPKKRGRKPKKSEEDEEEEESALEARREAEIRSAIPYRALDIVIDSILLKDSGAVTGMKESKPFKLVAGRSEKNAEVLPKKLSRLRKAMEARSNALNNLRGGPSGDTGGDDDDDDNLLPPTDREVKAADQNGLRVYEEKLRAEVAAAEEIIRGVHTFFKDKVIEQANVEAGKSARIELFTEDQLMIQGETFDRADMIAKLFAEELVVLNVGGPTKAPSKK